MNCVLLAIDPGATSGAAIFEPSLDHPPADVCGNYSCTTPGLRQHVVTHAISVASKHDLPLIVVAEQWAGKMTGMTYAGLGASWGRWCEQLEIAGHDMKAIDRIQVAKWRSTIFGQTRIVGSGRTAAERRKDATRKWKQRAIDWVRVAFGIEVGPDEAEAVCLGMAAMRQPGFEDTVRKAGRRMKKREKQRGAA